MDGFSDFETGGAPLVFFGWLRLKASGSPPSSPLPACQCQCQFSWPLVLLCKSSCAPLWQRLVPSARRGLVCWPMRRRTASNRLRMSHMHLNRTRRDCDGVAGKKKKSLAGMFSPRGRSYTKRYFVISEEVGDGSKTYAVSYFKDEAMSGPPIEALSLTGAKLRMDSEEWSLMFAYPLPGEKECHAVALKPEADTDLSTIVRFCEACTDFGVGIAVDDLTASSDLRSSLASAG